MICENLRYLRQSATGRFRKKHYEIMSNPVYGINAFGIRIPSGV